MGDGRGHGAPVAHPATFVSPGDIVQVRNQVVDAPGRTRLWRYHKPEGLVTTHRDPEGRPTRFEEEIKVSYIKFDNQSRILAFSAHPQAMAVYGGDVGLDEFAKHSNAQLLWQTAQGRVTWGHDMAVWSAHEGEDTLFNQFAQQARAQCGAVPQQRGACPIGAARRDESSGAEPGRAQCLPRARPPAHRTAQRRERSGRVGRACAERGQPAAA